MRVRKNRSQLGAGFLEYCATLIALILVLTFGTTLIGSKISTSFTKTAQAARICDPNDPGCVDPVDLGIIKNCTGKEGGGTETTCAGQ